jgi:hypothetical protein
MPIESLNDRTVELRCINCGAARTLELEKLELKLEPGARPDAAPAKIDLPVCVSADCCSTETLFASPAKPAIAAVPGSYGHLHSVLVDKLAAQLIKNRRVKGGEIAAAEEIIRTREEEVNAFFTEGLVLPLITSVNRA